jgi:hypothetical protein
MYRSPNPKFIEAPEYEMSFRYILTIVRTLNDQILIGGWVIRQQENRIEAPIRNDQILVVAEPAYQGTQAGDSTVEESRRIELCRNVSKP